MNVKIVKSGGFTVWENPHNCLQKKKKPAALQINKRKGNLALHLKLHAYITPHYTHTLLTLQPISSTQKHQRHTLTLHQGLHTKSIHLEGVDTYNIDHDLLRNTTEYISAN